MEENSILPYVEPIFRFCCKRLGNRYDAEDLSGEIICHILEGMEKYEVKSLDAWVWRIAHNRYARFIDARNKTRMILAEEAGNVHPRTVKNIFAAGNHRQVAPECGTPKNQGTDRRGQNG